MCSTDGFSLNFSLDRTSISKFSESYRCKLLSDEKIKKIRYWQFWHEGDLIEGLHHGTIIEFENSQQFLRWKSNICCIINQFQIWVKRLHWASQWSQMTLTLSDKDLVTRSSGSYQVVFQRFDSNGSETVCQTDDYRLSSEILG